MTGITDPATVNSDTTLGELGLDSLMGVEVKQTLERDYDLSLSMKEIRHLTVNKLHSIADGNSSTHLNDRTTEKPKDVSVKASRSLVPTETVVKLNDIEGNPALFIIHPIEGEL